VVSQSCTSSSQLVTVTSDDLRVIFNLRRGHYTGVSRHDSGWRARVFMSSAVAVDGGRRSSDRVRHVIGVFRTEVEAARAVVMWYRATFGEVWRHVFRYRRCRVWEVVRSGDGEGYTAWVWWRGVPELVTLADVKSRPCGSDRGRWVWPSRECARQAIRICVQRRLKDAGPEKMLNLYRLGPSRSPWLFDGFVAQAGDRRCEWLDGVAMA
jgi:hypothetical protein